MHPDMCPSMMPPPDEEPIGRGTVAFESWAGRTNVPVEILGETPKRYRVRWLETALSHTQGSVSLVPKYAVCLSEGEGD